MLRLPPSMALYISLLEGRAALFHFHSLLKRPNYPRDTGSSVLRRVPLHLLKAQT